MGLINIHCSISLETHDLYYAVPDMFLLLVIILVEILQEGVLSRLQ